MFYYLINKETYDVEFVFNSKDEALAYSDNNDNPNYQVETSDGQPIRG